MRGVPVRERGKESWFSSLSLSFNHETGDPSVLPEAGGYPRPCRLIALLRPDRPSGSETDCFLRLYQAVSLDRIQMDRCQWFGQCDPLLNDYASMTGNDRSAFWLPCLRCHGHVPASRLWPGQPPSLTTPWTFLLPLYLSRARIAL